MRTRLRQNFGRILRDRPPAAAPQARRLVGEVVVTHRRRNNTLAEGADEKVPLRHKGIFSRRPHLFIAATPCNSNT